MKLFAKLTGKETIAELQAQIAKLEADHKAAIEAKDKQITDLEANHKAAITKLEGDHTAAITAKDKQITDLEANHKAAIEAKEKSVSDRVSIAGMELAAAQGVPPIAAADSGAPGKSGSLLEQLDGIKDPKAKTVFINKNKAALNAELRKSATKK